MNLRKQEITELQKNIKDCTELQRTLEAKLSSLLAAGEKEKSEREQRIYNLSVKEWNRDFKMITKWVFCPIFALMIFALLVKGFSIFLFIRFVLTYSVVAVAFYTGNYVALKKGGTIGWFVGVGLFLGLSFLSIHL